MANNKQLSIRVPVRNGGGEGEDDREGQADGLMKVTCMQGGKSIFCLLRYTYRNHSFAL